MDPKNGHLSVDTNALHSASGSFNAQVQNLEDALRTITNTVEGLQASWKGNASASFQQAMMEWKTSVHNLNQALETISHNVNMSGNSYDEVESTVTNAFKGLTGYN
jgi:WXG100 family type VII secretion target